MDKIYGKPSQCELAVTIREKGFDRALEETNDETRKIKELLNSTVPKDFILGLVLLQGYMYDGGHTSIGIWRRSKGLPPEGYSKEKRREINK